jgi:hypothetical protein
VRNGKAFIRELALKHFLAFILMPTDIEIYCNCIARARYHLSVADAVFDGRITTAHLDLNTELIFIHFRKALEEIAFASLSANREKYSAARAGFATEWNARRMLGFIEKVNPNFYRSRCRNQKRSRQAKSTSTT